MKENINWEKFFSRHELIWDSLPLRWEEAPFIGTGLVGSLMYGHEKGLKFWVSRSDVGRLDYPGRARDPIRIQIGTLDLVPRHRIIPEKSSFRLDLWNAEVRGALATENGEINLRVFAPSGSKVVVVDVESETEQWSWVPDFIPEGRFKEVNDLSLFVADDYISHPRTETPSGGFAVAWKIISMQGNTSRFIFSVGSTPVNRKQWDKTDSGISAEKEAAEAIKNFSKKEYQEIIKNHRDWWHSYYKKSFFSISDREIESFYWIQLYKFACSTRPDFPMLDNHGVWSVEQPYGFSTWDYNVQSTYRLHLTSNHGDFGRPLLKFLEDNFNEQTMWNPKHQENRAGIRQQVFLRYRFFDTEHWEHAKDALCDGPGKFLWACHNYWLHYLHYRDESLLTNLLMMLEGGLNAMREGMKMENGKLVIPSGHSWECWKGKNPTGLLAVFIWALQTAITIGKRLGKHGEKVKKWEDWLKKVIDYPQGPEGFYLGEGQPPLSHRHWTHLFMIFPLEMLDLDDLEEMEFAQKSIDAWAGMSAGLNGEEARAFAPIAAMQLYASIRNPEKIARLADIYLHTQCTRAPGVWPNTVYREFGPVIEAPLFFANAIQECCLKTREDGVYVFPAIPEAWPNITFHNWHAGGDFLVSAEREDGETKWVRIKSLSGNKQDFILDFEPDQKTIENVQCSNRRVTVTLGRDDEIVLSHNFSREVSVDSVTHTRGEKNSFGKNDRFYSQRPWFLDTSKPLVRCKTG